MTVPSTQPPARMPWGIEPFSMPLVPQARRWKRSAVCTVPSRPSSPAWLSSLKTSSCADESNESLMAPATVPAASRLECSSEAPHATVDERCTPATFIVAARAD